jgi:hypothetical protein
MFYVLEWAAIQPQGKAQSMGLHAAQYHVIRRFPGFARSSFWYGHMNGWLEAVAWDRGHGIWLSELHNLEK